MRVGECPDIAVRHQRNGNYVPNGGDRIPICLAIVELHAGAA